MTQMNRREALLRMGGLVATGLFSGSIFAQKGINSPEAAALSLPADKPITVAHITDVHVNHENKAPEWLAKCLHEIQSNANKPSFILNTGDCIMDTTRATRSSADKQWKIWHDTFVKDCSIPVFSCLGNHDVWGLKTPEAKRENPKDPEYGKKLACDSLRLDKLYYSFDQGGWHFVMLDSIFPKPNASWMGKLDDEQFQWLENDLKAVPANRPICINSHVPIIQICSMASMLPDENHEYDFTAGLMMGDARRLIDLFKKYPNVKLCLSGHIHRLDRVELAGVTYICDGAVCGSKWKKLGRSTATPGYSITTLNPDGTFDYKYHTFGWKLEA